MSRVIVLAIGTAIIVTAGIFSYYHVLPGFLCFMMFMFAVGLCGRAGRLFNKKGIR